jgi:hypothetical protein
MKEKVCGECTTHGIGERYKRFSHSTRGERPLMRPRRRWKDSIKMCLKDIGCRVVKLIHLAVYRD